MISLEVAGSSILPEGSVFDIYRVPNNVVLKIIVPCGHPYNQLDAELVVTEGDGKTQIVLPIRSPIGVSTYEWVPMCAGPASLILRCTDVMTRQVCESDASIILVEPHVSVNDRHIKPNSICLCSVIAARLGPVDRWADILKVVRYQRFNAVHLTPIQKLGESKSSYSLADQLSISETLAKDSQSIQQTISELRSEYDLLFFEDLVLNHTASNSVFLRDHPDAGYNEKNSPWLKGAIELDNAIKSFTQEVIRGHVHGCSADVKTESDLHNLVKAFKERCLDPFQIQKWMWVNVTECKKLMDNTCVGTELSDNMVMETVWEEVLKHVGETRDGIVLSRELINSFARNDYQRVEKILGSMNDKLKALHQQVYSSIISAFEGSIKYERLQCHKGPVTGTPWNSFVPWYFTPVQTADGDTLHLANNGWVMDWDARKDFAAAGTLVYLKRTVLAWSDCVKLRYGTGPEDSPFLWDHMSKYCQQVATMFDGVRLDNCHSTPLAVGKHMLAQARSANKNLFVFAELFTGSMEVDAVFEKELGIDALVREAVQTSSPGDCAYHALKYSGTPVGALQRAQETLHVQPGTRPLTPSRAINIFYDCTHDNETPFQKGRAQDSLATAAMVCSSHCAVGSTLGYEVLMRTNPSVVDDGEFYEPRKVTGTADTPRATPNTSIDLVWTGPASTVEVWGTLNNWSHGYTAIKRDNAHVWTCELAEFPLLTQIEFKFVVDGRWTTSPDYKTIRDPKGNVNNVILTTQPMPRTESLSGAPGIVEARKILNQLHQRLSDEGYDEVAVQWPADDFQIIERHNRMDGFAVCFFIRSHWWRGPDIPSKRDVTVAGQVLEHMLCCAVSLDQRHFHQVSSPSGIVPESSCLVTCQPPSIHYDGARDVSYINFSTFPSGSVFVCKLRVERPEVSIVNAFGKDDSELCKAVAQLSLCDINYLLWSCDEEERDRTQGSRGVYGFPGLESNPVFAGFGGAAMALDAVHMKHGMEHSSHVVHKNMAEGPWLAEYHIARLRDLHTATSDSFRRLVETALQAVVLAKQSAWRPSALDYLICKVYRRLVDSIINRLPERLNTTGEPLVWRLAVAATHVLGEVRTSSLYADRPSMTMSAGLPFFSREYMREWGRDTFLALPGLLLATGRWPDARAEILAYAHVLRHAMIPNLMDSGNNPRYNARDAVWFWLYSVQQYVKLAPSGEALLAEKVETKFPPALDYEAPAITTVADMIHHILSCHYTGIEYREWNAGLQIDCQMKDPGFNVSVKFDRESGFCLGGNRFNCGTWMDKMGSSEKAGNKGVPATPRDGAPVELTCALYSCLVWVTQELIPNGLFPYTAATHCKGGEGLLYADWKALLEEQFGRRYHVDGMSGGVPETYKDTYGCEVVSEDLHLRCNYSVGFTFAPSIDDRDKIRKALDVAYSRLVNEPDQVGMKTLDPKHPAYRPNYDNGDDGYDKAVAHGWNYHQGPEWVWPLGYWYTARWLTADQDNLLPTLYQLTSQLTNVRNWIRLHPWQSLPEIMNQNGKLCTFSCQTQAWSIGSFLMFFDAVATQMGQGSQWQSSVTVTEEVI